jgi:hypothetical protein
MARLPPNVRHTGQVSDNCGPLPFVQLLGAVLTHAGESAYPNFSYVDQGGNSFVAYLQVEASVGKPGMPGLTSFSHVSATLMR